jgi:hypothetical protein
LALRRQLVALPTAATTSLSPQTASVAGGRPATCCFAGYGLHGSTAPPLHTFHILKEMELLYWKDDHEVVSFFGYLGIEDGDFFFFVTCVATPASCYFVWLGLLSFSFFLKST